MGGFVFRLVGIALTLLAILATSPIRAQSARDAGIAGAQAATAPNGMVATQEARATRAGVDVLDRGGNAVDAAVAVGFALAVTYPRAGNIGGGGFMVIHLAARGES